MPEGGIITVTCENVSSIETPNTSTLPKGLFVKIYIRDEGIGMSANIVEKSLTPIFNQGKGSAERDGVGTGYGLCDCKAAWGHITVNSSPGAGTTVNIYFPAENQPEEIDGAITLDDDKALPEKRLLVMDDEEMLRTLAQKMLERLGYEVETVNDGAEAIEAYKKQKDLVSPL